MMFDTLIEVENPLIISIEDKKQNLPQCRLAKQTYTSFKTCIMPLSVYVELFTELCFF